MNELSKPNDFTLSTPIPQRPFRLSKRWKKVSNGTHPNNLKAFNNTKMLNYQFLLAKVKTLLEPGTIYFDRDYNEDGDEPFVIHCFLTDSFYWYIECDTAFNINIRYQFQYCPIESEVRQAFREYDLTEYITEVSKPSLASFHKGVIAYQKPQFIHIS